MAVWPKWRIAGTIIMSFITTYTHSLPSPNGGTFDHLSIRRRCFRPWIGRSLDWWVPPPPLSTRNSLGPKVRHLLKFNLSFQCSLVVHVFSMVFAMVIFCKVIFYYGPKLIHWLKLVFDLIFFYWLMILSRACNGFMSFPWSQLWHWNCILTYSMPCLLIFHWCLQRCYFIVKLYWNKKTWDHSDKVYAMLQPRLQVL